MMRHSLHVLTLCSMAFTCSHALAVDKPAVAASPIKQSPVKVDGTALQIGPLAGGLDQIQSIKLSQTEVALTGTSVSVTVSVNSQHGPCASDVYINGVYSASMYTVDSLPPITDGLLPSNGSLNFGAPGSYDIVAKKSLVRGPALGCNGQAKAVVKVSAANPNWPCSTYGFIKAQGALFGPGQFVCVPANTPASVPPMACPEKSIFFNFGPMFGCLPPGMIANIVSLGMGGGTK